MNARKRAVDAAMLVDGVDVEAIANVVSDVWEPIVRELLEVVDNALFPHLSVPEYIATRDMINRAKAAVA